VLEDSALMKEAALLRKIKVVGNYVHDSVPIHNNEALPPWLGFIGLESDVRSRTLTASYGPGPRRATSPRSETAFLIMKS